MSKIDLSQEIKGTNIFRIGQFPTEIQIWRSVTNLKDELAHSITLSIFSNLQQLRKLLRDSLQWLMVNKCISLSCQYNNKETADHISKGGIVFPSSGHLLLDFSFFCKHLVWKK